MSEENLHEEEEIEEVEVDEAEEIPEDIDDEIDESLSVEDQLAQAKQEAEEYLDGWRRERAELANARKRLEKQRIDSYQNATIAVMSKLLPALDDFDRAMENAPDAIKEDGWFEGVEIVQRKLNNILESAKIEPIEALNEQFDPLMHEAVMSEAAEDVESGTVLKVLQNGYKLGDRVIRPALVSVAQ